MDISLLLKASDSNESSSPPPSRQEPKEQQTQDQEQSQPAEALRTEQPKLELLSPQQYQPFQHPQQFSHSQPQHRHHTRSTSVPSLNLQQASVYAPANPSPGGKRTMPSHPLESPAKKQSKWSAEEDALIIELRGSGMKWEDISRRLPGRSAISCRLHYQNYLERRSEWDEERKNKLARLYER